MPEKTAVTDEKPKLCWHKHIVCGQNLEINIRKILLSFQIKRTEKIWGYCIIIIIILSLSRYLT